ncbi:hypothetical protein [Hymenobacter cheonanensis]|uniref:hypothetical protein n=1 Tax=Hymenobacter sp. CA2-7 TaxID=3063993 RepID=UPI002713D4CC|nr:hypothetical protein [Hymenobacter sp. CA2-7]MDO7885601.1 hypothetical protein [Hymenobacter sp. CA2-7]
MHYRYVSLLATGLLALAAGCQKADEAPGCGTLATVRNLTGLDGCGYVLQLDTGKRLEPHGSLWQGFGKHDGDRVTISYESEPGASICMVGEGVKLTCIQAR